jgi:hypothetical protein
LHICAGSRHRREDKAGRRHARGESTRRVAPPAGRPIQRDRRLIATLPTEPIIHD